MRLRLHSARQGAWRTGIYAKVARRGATKQLPKKPALEMTDGDFKISRREGCILSDGFVNKMQFVHKLPRVAWYIYRHETREYIICYNRNVEKPLGLPSVACLCLQKKWHWKQNDIFVYYLIFYLNTVFFNPYMHELFFCRVFIWNFVALQSNILLRQWHKLFYFHTQCLSGMVAQSDVQKCTSMPGVNRASVKYAAAFLK